MNNQYTMRFILDFFSWLNEESCIYCILRGYETLPEEAGRDIDIFIADDNKIIERILRFIQELSWNYHVKIDEDGFFSIVCSYIQENTISVIQLDFWTSLNWRGIAWCDSKEILSDLRLVNGFFVAAKGTEAAITSIKELMGKGKVKKKYYDIIQKYAIEDSNKYIRCLKPAFGEIANKLCEYCSSADFKKLDQISGLLMRRLVFDHFICYINHTCKRIMLKLKSYIKPSGKLVAFLGPDGSGKTTVIEQQKEYFAPFFNSIKVYHIRYNLLPELKTGHGFSSMKGKLIDKSVNGDIQSVKKKRTTLSVLASWFVVLYYALEFVIGNRIIRKAKRGNQLVLFDRYFYDFFMQPTTRDLIYPFRHLLLAFVTKPDVIIHLNADPEIVHARKQELRIEEISAQNLYIYRLIKEMSYAYSINTSRKSADYVSVEVFKLLSQKSLN
jgi:thymidylate kinase